MQDTLFKQEQTFLWYGECIHLSRITLHCAVTELHTIHLSMPHFPVLKKRYISQTLHPFSEKARGLSSRVLFLGKYAAPCLPLFLSLSHILSVIPFSPLFRSPHVPVAVCVEISGESIWVLSSVGPGSLTAWPKEACSFP